MKLNQHIKETIGMILFNAEISAEISSDILARSDDYFAKHKANEIKAKQEDTVRMVGALKQLLKEE